MAPEVRGATRVYIQALRNCKTAEFDFLLVALTQVSQCPQGGGLARRIFGAKLRTALHCSD